MKTIVYLIRHGELDNPKNIYYGGSLDIPLSDDGRKQISRLGSELKAAGVNPDTIYTSDFSRTRESGEILAKVFGKVIRVDIRLGDNKIPQFAGLTREETRLKFPNKDEFDPSLKGHETKEQLAKRMLESFREIIATNIGKTIFIVSHDDPLRLLIYKIKHPDEMLIPSPSTLPGIEKGSARKITLEIDKKTSLIEFIK